MSDRVDDERGADARADATLDRREEELELRVRAEPAGAVKARKRVETERVEQVVPRQIEHADVERLAPDETDSGEVETHADGSVSIPIFAEELVVTKRLVVRERVLVRKRTVTEQHRIEAELRKERVELEGDGLPEA